MLRRELTGFFLLHLIFAAICTLVLVYQPDWTIGPKLFGLVILYNISIPLVARMRRFRNWMAVWSFVFPLSLLMVIPVWFLASYLDVVSFPGGSVFNWFGTVPAYIAGLWSIPLFIITYLSLQVEYSVGTIPAYLVVGLMAILIFGFAEHWMWNLSAWRIHGVRTYGNTARFVLYAEIVLSWATFAIFRHSRKRSLPVRILGAALVVLIYSGSLALSYFFVEDWS